MSHGGIRRRTAAWPLILILALAALGCIGSGGRQGGPSTMMVAETESYQAFVDEFCGHWSTVVWGPGREKLYEQYHDRIQALPTRAVNDYPFRVLRDITLVECWYQAAHVVGLGGTAEDGERLMRFLDDFRPGETTSLTMASRMRSNIASARHALGFLAARLGESHPSGRRIIDHIVACTRTGYWLETGRLAPWRPEWRRDGFGEAEYRESASFLSQRRCIQALGNTGSTIAADYLNSLQDNLDDTMLRYRLELSIEYALRRNAIIHQMGLERFIREGPTQTL